MTSFGRFLQQYIGEDSAYGEVAYYFRDFVKAFPSAYADIEIPSHLEEALYDLGSIWEAQHYDHNSYMGTDQFKRDMELLEGRHNPAVPYYSIFNVPVASS